MSYPNITRKDIDRLFPGYCDIPEAIKIQIENDARYDSYITRQKNEIAMLKRDHSYKIPKNFNYRCISGLSNELILKLTKVKP